MSTIIGGDLQQILWRNSLRFTLESSKVLSRLGRDVIARLVRVMTVREFTNGEILAERGSLVGA
jgi:hypothetical protein